MYRKHKLPLKSQKCLIMKGLTGALPNHHITITRCPYFPKETYIVTVHGVRYKDKKKVSSLALSTLLDIYLLIGETKYIFVLTFENYKTTKKWHPEYLKERS